MAIISFWGNSKKETGQTLSVVAIGTEMAIEHNTRVLVISTGFRDNTVENCFWIKKRNAGITEITGVKTQSGFDNGFEGLVKVIQSNRTSTNIIRDYTKVVFRDRLDILLPPKTDDPRVYNSITQYYKDILKIANKEYSIVLVDVDKRINGNDKGAILQGSDIIMVTFKQCQESLDMARAIKEKNPNSKTSNIMFMAGKYDFDSKFNTKNLSRTLREIREISAVPYNAGFYDASTEGKVADFFLNNRSLTDFADSNFKFIEECKRSCNNITDKISTMRMMM